VFYRAAATLARREPERRFPLRRLTEVGGWSFPSACRKPSKPFD
jgi:hypothetical protein